MLTLDDGALSRWASLVDGPARADATWLMTIGSTGREDGEAPRVGLIADSDTLVEEHVWMYARCSGALVVRPSVLLQWRCVEPAVRAAVDGRPEDARRHLELVVRSFATQGVQTVVAACAPLSRPARQP